MDDLRLHLFGPPRVEVGGSPVSFDTRKAIALLAYLAVTGRRHGRDGLAALLWPAAERTRARATLRRTLSVASAVGPALHADRGEVWLDPSAWCDVVEFRALAAAADADSWRRAADLAADEFLAGFTLRDSAVFEDWQLATADALRDRLSAVLGRLVAASTADGDLDGALDVARRRVAVEPLSEPAHVDLVRLTAWTGDRPGALRLYRALVRVLDRELGVPPLPATTALHEAIRADRLEPPPRPADPAGPSAVAPPDLPADPPSATPSLDESVVGRDGERQLLAAAWREAAAVGRVLGLVGDAGMGRTALATGLAEQVGAAGGAVVGVVGRAAERDLPFAAAADLVRTVLAARPDLRDRLGPALAGLALLAPEPGSADVPAIAGPGALRGVYDAVRLALAAVGEGPTPALLVIDDAHLLDAPSADLLAYTVRRRPPGLLTVVTWETGGGSAILPAAVTESGGPRALVPLGPLDAAAVAEILGRAGRDPGGAAAVLERTRGVPLLVMEDVAGGAGSADLPDGGVRSMVAARLEAAPATTQQVVGAAAVIGAVADPELLRVTCGRAEVETVEAIEDALARRLLVERTDRGGYDLPHDLVRDAVLARTSLARARLLHGRVGEALARRHALDPVATPAGVVATHLASAGREVDAAGWYWRAAQESRRLYAHAQAVTQLRAALALGHDPIAVHAALGEALVPLGRYGEALVELEQAAASVEDDLARLASIEHRIAGVHDRLGDWDLAQAHLVAARDLVAGAGLGGLARVTADLALVLHRRGRAADAADAARTAGDLARVEGDVAARTQADNVLGVLASAAGDLPGAVRHLDEAVTSARELSDGDLLVATLNNLARVHAQQGLPEEALRAATEALAIAERQGDRHRLAALHSHVADLLHAAGRDAEAMERLKASAAAFAEVDEAELRPQVWTLAEW